ncbi:hypothetical protein K2D_01820 [Planctomycetes bacterium K2D]|uniref:Uncharacterized protein n=1 Tax=Botrimarina mediterranea TaxID=2528022 RepID=A0A518K2P5_9BACT|nr:hypothetical protein Spa11_02320 [Botrimarina mediterranea]QDV76603.1 hypothetical protein K2D_01820 [Planctomycetes bacterium K2D]
MNVLDQLYIRLLHHGLQILRDAAACRDTAWSHAEAELLHNVPSLIGESNLRRHAYFWDQERRAYLAWLEQSENPRAVSKAKTFYDPIWREMEVELHSKIEHLTPMD